MSHPSFRVSVQGKALFHPYYLLDTVDQLRERQLEKWPACMSLRGMSRFGRPMWGAMTSGNNPIIATELQKLAIQKLVGGGNKSLESIPQPVWQFYHRYFLYPLHQVSCLVTH